MLMELRKTEEMLLKCGFKKFNRLINESWEYSLNIQALKLYARQNSGTWYFEFGGIYLGDMIKYVHELQNFSFSFGKELEIKL